MNRFIWLVNSRGRLHLPLITSNRACRPWSIAGATILVSCHVVKSLQLIWRWSTVPDTHKFPLDARIRIASHARIRIASHRIACGEMRACASIRIACAKCAHSQKCAHSHRMRGNASICAHSHRMRWNARIRIACAGMRAYARIRIVCAEMRALRRERRVNEIARMTPARVFWRQTPGTGFVVVRCIHKYWG